MLHPGPLIAAGAVDVALEPGAAPALDLAAAADARARAFLRAAWFGASANGAPLKTLVARRPGGEPVAAIPLAQRRMGPLTIAEVPGSYWPFRSFPIACDAGADELAALLASPAARAALGRAWRIGPVYADDPGAARLAAAAGGAGWTILTRRVGTCYVVDLARLTAAGPWPSAKTLRKNRWLERRLAESGELDFDTVSGDQWTPATFELLAAIEAESWVAKQAGGGDTKFLDPDARRIWQRAVGDPLIAAMLGCSILHVGGAPAAFTFTLRCGPTLYFLANGYSERFAEGSPGRILLYRDLQAAAASGVSRIGWGAGDPGYKSEMGAEPGPDIVDHLIVRGPLAALARPLWRGRAG